MAASSTVSQLPQFGNLVTPRHGVLTLYGYGITVCVNRGHLILKDGIGRERREARFPRVGHGLRRLIVIGTDGMISLAALRWLADQDAAFVMLDRDGSVLATTGPVSPSDARLRRAQSLAQESGAALQISRELIGQKLQGQEQIARDKLNDPQAAEIISLARAAIPSAQSIKAIRQLESRAAHAYWGAWNELAINFPKSDLRRVPEHWLTFRNRISPLTGSPRLAANPLNAMLNYLYALLESEARLAVAALGLDPGLGVMHMDMPVRDSLACDVMEPVRPVVDAYLLNWISDETLRRDWFFEQRDGSCRLMGPFTVRLSQTSQAWRHAVAPWAELVRTRLWATVGKPGRQPSTPLTGNHRRSVRAGEHNRPVARPPKPPRVCKTCGVPCEKAYCASCGAAHSLKEFEKGRLAAQSPESRARRSATQKARVIANRNWKPSKELDWLDRETYIHRIQPRLAGVTISAVRSALGVSEPHAIYIRAGSRIPHRRHWQTLANLVGVDGIEKMPEPGY
jgi:CRISPR-associated endonuclease Cas1